ncbi:MAG: HAD-IA family hydrolase [Verrucomicrobiota bacterium]|nr:HAD-IA family hydrolase [Verrucomicrobiota bacterium]
MKYANIVVLDIGGVCCHLNFGPLKKLVDSHLCDDTNNISSDLFSLSHALECGEIETQDFFFKLFEVFGGKIPLRELNFVWNSIIGEEISGMPEIVDEIKNAGMDVVLLSDTSKVHMKIIKKNFSIIKKITGYVTSYQVGCRKPTPAMYHVLEEKFCKGKKPFLYTDDKAENLLGAEKCGWRTHHFKSPDCFIREFRKLIAE